MQIYGGDNIAVRPSRCSRLSALPHRSPPATHLLDLGSGQVNLG